MKLDLLPGGTTSRATGVNDRGFVVGYADTADNKSHAIRWSPHGHATDLGTLPGGTRSYAYGINRRGDIVGYSDAADGHERAVRWASDGTITDLGGLPGHPNGYAYGINDEGTVVGQVSIQSRIYHAVKWAPDGTATDLGIDAPRGSTNAVAVNDHGAVAGYSFQVGPGHYIDAATWPAGATTVTLLPLLPDGGARSNAAGINDKGLIVGEAQSKPGNPGRSPLHAVVWSPGASAPTDLGIIPGADDHSTAYDINAADTVAGSSATSTPGARQAVLWKRGKDGWSIVPLPQLPDGNYSEATAISDRGAVVGSASVGTDPSIAVRWE
ncbi:hypothetical protein [Actinomadura terrae]|uniref:hypothetical protein n=1 Tax=Actinomadura terrae TaxID=604353 RepID=UPI001FA7BA97|nr:hypothetical protein [Actinomadura terrae]